MCASRRLWVQNSGISTLLESGWSWRITGHSASLKQRAPSSARDSASKYKVGVGGDMNWHNMLVSEDTLWESVLSLHHVSSAMLGIRLISEHLYWAISWGLWVWWGVWKKKRVCVSVCISVSVFLCLCVRVCVNVSMCKCVREYCMYVCEYMCGWESVCECVCM